MAARTLVQALEGAHFPCDRAQLLDYARRNNLGDGTLAVLEGIPERSYRDLSEVFTALPERPRQSGREQSERQAPEGGGEEAEEPERGGLAGPEWPPLPAPMEWWLNGWRQMMMPWDAAAQCWKGSAESWPQWLRLTRHLWFPWSKE